MALVDTGRQASYPDDIMLRLTWEGIDALVAARAEVRRICGNNRNPMPSHGPGGVHLQVNESHPDMRDKLKTSFAANGWTVRVESESFFVFEWSKKG